MNADDIQKLRRKFISITMLSVFIVLLIVGAAVNLISYAISLSSIRNSLDQVMARELSTGNKMFEEEFQPNSRIFAPQYAYNRLYVLRYDGEKTLTGYTTNVKDSETEFKIVSEYSDGILQGKKTFGRKHNYYYSVGYNGDETIIVFLNCSTEIAAIYRILLLTAAVWGLALIVTFILVYLFSGKAVKPEIENNLRQQEFITNAGHELKTPLAVIRANTELLELMDGENEWTKSTLNQVDRMDGLIKQLVLMAKTRENKQVAEKMLIDISEEVKRSVESFRAVATQKEKILKEDIVSGITLHAEEGKIEQLSSILTDNAIKYCDENGEITVSLKQGKKNEKILTVSNSYAEGKGDDCSKFFERFYRKDRSHNVDNGGYGIGLSIAEKICEENSGSIKAHWDNGKIYFVCRFK